MRAVEALVLDCDGVLTAGGLYYDHEGHRLLRFDSRDGLGIGMLCRSGIAVAVLSGRPVDIAEARLRDLGVRHFRGSCHDKAQGLVDLCEAMGVAAERAAYLGDDLPDLAAFSRAGVRIGVRDAAPEVVAAADWVTHARGGFGAVREVCEQILKARGTWRGLVARMAGQK